ncbi:MAG: AAA family ATPase, partial [bacterium]|nr:AAA family ATPase [bacterium]
TGVGKTETSKALAQIYFGGRIAKKSRKAGSSDAEEKMIRIDMSEFQAISDIPRLIGSISPVEMQGLLTTPVRETPFSLVLLDEIEKAHPNILNLFLQVLDEGHITDGQGRKVVFTNTIIICTSNAGAETIFKEAESGRKVDKDKLFNSLFEKGIFRPEFINRFDATIIFNPLTKDNLLKIAQLMLQVLQKNLKEKEIDFEITEPLKEKIVSLSYKPAFGAREMRRVIQDKVENNIAEALISETIKKGDKIEVDPETFKVIKDENK